ncbi:MAG: hypothetical protein HZA02_08035, partial [Nitrospinae bacterium]|nr:hypothetical protein [Nitrospinota bacterium]
MDDSFSILRKWIKKGLSKDGKTLDLSNRRIDMELATDLAESYSLDVEIMYLNATWLKDNSLEELAGSGFFTPSLRELW